MVLTSTPQYTNGLQGELEESFKEQKINSSAKSIGSSLL